jgi:hypothetical protein
MLTAQGVLVSRIAGNCLNVYIIAPNSISPTLSPKPKTTLVPGVKIFLVLTIRAKAENRARTEIPMFLVLRAIKIK